MSRYLWDKASAMDRRVSVCLRDTPERIVTPLNDSLLLKDSTVKEISSPDIEGMKHSIPDMIMYI
jgi:hypothetical protein